MFGLFAVFARDEVSDMLYRRMMAFLSVRIAPSFWGSEDAIVVQTKWKLALRCLLEVNSKSVLIRLLSGESMP